MFLVFNISQMDKIFLFLKYAYMRKITKLEPSLIPLTKIKST